MLYNDGRAEYIHREGCEYIEKRKMGRRNNINSTQQLVPVVFFLLCRRVGKKGGQRKKPRGEKKGPTTSPCPFRRRRRRSVCLFLLLSPTPVFLFLFLSLPFVYFFSSALGGRAFGERKRIRYLPLSPLLARLIHCCWHESLPPLLQLE